jgi:hypothetical protein
MTLSGITDMSACSCKDKNVRMVDGRTGKMESEIVKASRWNQCSLFTPTTVESSSRLSVQAIGTRDQGVGYQELVRAIHTGVG